MYKICVFLFLLQMTVARPQDGGVIPPETTSLESTTKNDVELISDETTVSGNSSETEDTTDPSTSSAASSVSSGDSTTTTEETTRDSTEDTSDETTDENCDKHDNPVVDIIVVEEVPFFPPFFKK